jgi:hypothetical protein
MKIEASVEVSNVAVVVGTAIVAAVASYFINEAMSDCEHEEVPDTPVYATFRDSQQDRHRAFAK